MSSSGTNLASGTRAALRYIREGVRNSTPVLTAITDIESQIGNAEEAVLIRSAGSFIDDGFIAGQTVTVAGLASGNGEYTILSVDSATQITVSDPSDDIPAEASDPANTVQLRFEKLRATGRNVNLEKNELESEEVDPDGMESEVRHGFNRVVGSPGFQLSLADYDDVIEFALGGTWREVDISGLTSASADNAGVITFDAGVLATGVRGGDVVRLSGGDASYTGDFFVTAVTDTTITLAAPESDYTFTNAGGSPTTHTVPGSRMDLATNLCTIALERAFTDIAQFQVFNGVAVDQFQLNIAPEAIIGGTINLLGMSAAALSGSAASALDPLDPPTNAPMAAFDGSIYEGGTLIGVVTAVNFTLARGRSLNAVVGSKFSPDVFEGTARISGTLTAYFENATLLNKFINETDSSMYFRLQDPDTATSFLAMAFHRVKYNGGTIDPPQEGPISLEMPFRALKATGLNAIGASTTVNTSMTIQRSNS